MKKRGKGGGGGGVWNPKVRWTKNGPNQYFRLRISYFPTLKSGSRRGGGVQEGGGVPPPLPMVVSRSNTSLTHAIHELQEQGERSWPTPPPPTHPHKTL